VAALYQGRALRDLQPVAVLLDAAGGGQPVLVSATPAGAS
jgi:hypothetical protein